MKDTLGGAQLLPPSMSDEALLLRQQEEFINKNRMHIEKRRHDRSPEPRKRDYSPPPSSHRDRPHGPSGSSSSRYNRRGHSPSGHRGAESGRISPKRRRSMDGPMDNHGPASTPLPDPDEDEETRAYRLKIEKQKAMRDKILRDKEMRRRRAADQKDAAEEKVGHNSSPQQAPAVDEPVLSRESRGVSPKQLTPLVVTQKKIISLKSKSKSSSGSSSAGGGGASSNAMVVDSVGGDSVRPTTKRVVLQRGRMGPGSVAGAVKPVVIKRSLGNDSDEFDEDELLADSPPPPTSSAPVISQKRSLTPPIVSSITRRIVLSRGGGGKTGGGDQKTTTTSTAASTGSKGVFDRLEKRVGVSEVAKRKLKRIVIKHLE